MIITKFSFFTFAVSVSWHRWQPHEFLDCMFPTIHNLFQSPCPLCPSLLAAAEGALLGFMFLVVSGRRVPPRTLDIFVADLVKKVAPKGT